MSINTIEIALKMDCEVRLTKEQAKQLHTHIEQLQARVVELKAANKALEQNRDQYKREAYALAAHVEYLKGHLEAPIKAEFNDDCQCNFICQHCGEHLGSKHAAKEEHEKTCDKIPANQTPATSLAERDVKVVIRFVRETIDNMQGIPPGSKAVKWAYYESAVMHFVDSANEYAKRVRRGEA